MNPCAAAMSRKTRKRNWNSKSRPPKSMEIIVKYACADPFNRTNQPTFTYLQVFIYLIYISKPSETMKTPDIMKITTQISYKNDKIFPTWQYLVSFFMFIKNIRRPPNHSSCPAIGEGGCTTISLHLFSSS